MIFAVKQYTGFVHGNSPLKPTWLYLLMETMMVTLVVLLLSKLPVAQSIFSASNLMVQKSVISGGGQDDVRTANYALRSTIGEPLAQHIATEDYTANVGYRQPSSDAYLSLTCGDTVDLGTLANGTGQATASGACIVITDADGGYTLAWNISSGSGGIGTGYLVNQMEELIAPFSLTVPNVPETWFVAVNDAEWGARISSMSTDIATEWGTDGLSEAWLNIGTGSTRAVVQRHRRTALSGSTIILEFRGEVGTEKVQPPGTYRATISLTATSF